ncbi:hypothetical protein DBV15_02061 [Temnothorax longispinosus]|uniref:BED-type domain-containing protein n=1 Tax=Temnothorax longispinosus TaxID=300112 RepID=A0A4S2KJS9_9HYME|nr:hypothetical protein DBV15_02061 [Temnothorax longispinosus]
MTVIMAPKRKRSKFWNYFEDLKPSLVKCTTCKEKIKISNPSNRIIIFRAHLERHGIFLDNDTLSLPDELKQYYSELPGYKAKCNNCGKADTDKKTQQVVELFQGIETYAAKVQDLTTPTKKRSKLWKYFEELKPTLLKCTTCKREIKVPTPGNYTNVMRRHLSDRHGIFLDNDTLPDNLRQFYSKLPGCKAKCNNCGKIDSYSGLKKKRSKFWNYFEELKPLLVKCTTCKKEIKIPHRNKFVSIFRRHLFNVHGIFLDNDILSLTT